MRRSTRLLLASSLSFSLVGAPVILGAPTGVNTGVNTSISVIQPQAAHAGANEWNNLKPSRSPEEIDAVKRAIKKMSDMGVHKGAICGVMGNGSQESGFNLATMEGDPGSNSNSIGAWGIVQLLGVRKEAFLNWTNSENGGSLKTDAQMQYAFEIEPGVAGLGDSFKQPVYYNAIATKGAMVPNVKQYTFEEIGSIDGYKKLDDPRAAALAWEAVWERAGVGEAELSTRTESAAQICEDEELFKDLPNLEGNNNNGEKKEDKKDNKEQTHDAKKASSGNATPVDELDLQGMEGRKAYESRSAAANPSFPTKDDLSRKDQVGVGNLADEAKTAKEYPGSNLVALGIAVGIIMMVYSLIVMLATILEKGGSILPGRWVNTVTLGRYNLALSDNVQKNLPTDNEGWGKQYTSGQVYGRAVLMFIVGALLVAGSLTAAFGTLLNVMNYYLGR